MNDEFDDLEQKLARHYPPAPSDDLRRRIAALPRQAAPGFWWQGLAAAVLATFALVQILASSARFTPPAPAGDTSAAAAAIRQLDLPLSDAEAALLARNLAAGMRIHPLPELHGRPGIDPSFGVIP